VGLGLADPEGLDVGLAVGLGVTVGVGDGVGVTVGVAVLLPVGLGVGCTVGFVSVGEGAGVLPFATTNTMTSAMTATAAMIAVTIHARRALPEPRFVE
jgi:spore coat protein U-like protein